MPMFYVSLKLHVLHRLETQAEGDTSSPEQVITPVLHHPIHSLVRAGPGASLGIWVDEERRSPDPT